jgi:SAM-dependent methyltransferase
MPLDMFLPIDEGNFPEAAYLATHPDVADAVRSGRIPSGWRHYDNHGRGESRLVRRTDLAGIRAEKMKRLAPHLRTDLRAVELPDGKLSFLTDELRALAEVEDTDAVSAHSYDSDALDLANGGGLVLDCGSGKRDIYFENVVNFEIANYDTTDVLGVAEELPFEDQSFDAVISIAVLEHVKDPFRCAAEISRVLKPGGQLYCCVPFLQPFHGYPHHYYNMTHEGLRALFSGRLDVLSQSVLPSTSPIWSLTWILNRWAAQLPPEARSAFMGKTVREIVSSGAHALLDENWVSELPVAAQFELASATVIRARRPIGGDAARKALSADRPSKESHELLSA